MNTGVHTVIGPPGCGKTHFLRQRVERLVQSRKGFTGRLRKDYSPALICSLTRAAAVEIASRCTELPPEATATIHAHAYRALGHMDVLDANDLREWSGNEPYYALSAGAAPDKDDLSAAPGKLPGDIYLEQYNLLRNQCTPEGEWPDEYLRFAHKYEAWKQSIGKIDFTDMVALALEKDVDPPLTPEVVFLDEAQDTSRLAWRLLRRWMDKAGSGIAVGDPWQSLYGWAGADSQVLTDPSIPDDHRGVLSQSFRVPRDVRQFAVDFMARHLNGYQEIKYAPRKPTEDDPAYGLVERCGATWRYPDAAVEDALDRINYGGTAMLITSCNYMTQPIVDYCRAHGIPFSNPWRTKNGGWNPIHTAAGSVSMAQRVEALLRMDKSLHRDRRLWTWSEMSHWTAAITTKGFLKHGRKKYIEEQAAARGDDWVPIAELMEMLEDWDRDLGVFEQDTNGILKWWHDRVPVAKRFSAQYAVNIVKHRGLVALRETPRLFIGTAHSFKGAEADNVYVFPDLSNEAYSTWGTVNGNPVAHAMYVAFTRARHTLTLCSASGGQYVPFAA